MRKHFAFTVGLHIVVYLHAAGDPVQDTKPERNRIRFVF